MQRIFLPLVLAVLLSCDDSNQESTLSRPVAIACAQCNKKPGEMAWLQNLIHLAKTDPSLMGAIYTGQHQGRVVFIHQPVVMSCLACVVYDCDGNKLDTSTLDHESLRLLMDRWHKIYAPESD